MASPAPFLSVIVPVLDEATIIVAFLAQVRAVVPAAEVIVVDGGSADATARLAAPQADVFLTAPRGRAAQMNAGSRVARGEVLWFLHADSILPPNAAAEIARALADARTVGGCFRLRFPRREPIYRVSDSLGNAGVEVFGFALGDHGIFCRRGSFEMAGGYPLVPLLEDAEIYRRLRRLGRMRQLAPAIVSSPRLYEALGPYRTTATYFLILALYVCGVPIRFLHSIYRVFRRSCPVTVDSAFRKYSGRQLNSPFPTLAGEKHPGSPAAQDRARQRLGLGTRLLAPASSDRLYSRR